MLMNNTIPNTNCQQKLNKENPLLVDTHYLNFTKSQQSIFRVMILSSDKDGRITLSHGLIAREAGCRKSTVKTALNEMNKRGIVSWESGKKAWTFNTYFLNPIYNNCLMKLGAKMLYTIFAVSLSLCASTYTANSDLQDNWLQIRIKGDIKGLYRDTRLEIENFSAGSPVHYDYLEESGGLPAHKPPGDFPKRVPKKKNQGGRMANPAKDPAENIKWGLIEQIADKFFLQPRGIVVLRQYSICALRFALLRIEDCYTKLEPFKYFLAILEKGSRDSSLPIDRELYYQNCLALGITQEDPYLDEDLLEELIQERLNSPVSQTVQREKTLASLKKESIKAKQPSSGENKYPIQEQERVKDQSFYEEQIRRALSEMKSNPEPNIFEQILINSWSQEPSGSGGTQAT